MIAAQGLLIQCLIGWQAHLFNLNGNASYAPKPSPALNSISRKGYKLRNCLSLAVYIRQPDFRSLWICRSQRQGLLCVSLTIGNSL